MDNNRNMRCNMNCNKSSSCMQTRQKPAMGYVPDQIFCKTYDLCKALKVGTIFPELHKPFCGKGGGVCR